MIWSGDISSAVGSPRLGLDLANSTINDPMANAMLHFLMLIVSLSPLSFLCPGS